MEFDVICGRVNVSLPHGAQTGTGAKLSGLRVKLTVTSE
jgi:hypothetical protein